MADHTDTLVCIGGPADGKRVRIKHGQRLMFQSDEGVSFAYHREMVRGHEEAFMFWRWEKMPIDLALVTFFNGYRNARGGGHV